MGVMLGSTWDAAVSRVGSGGDCDGREQAVQASHRLSSPVDAPRADRASGSPYGPPETPRAAGQPWHGSRTGRGIEQRLGMRQRESHGSRRLGLGTRILDRVPCAGGVILATLACLPAMGQPVPTQEQRAVPLERAERLFGVLDRNGDKSVDAAEARGGAAPRQPLSPGGCGQERPVEPRRVRSALSLARRVVAAARRARPRRGGRPRAGALAPFTGSDRGNEGARGALAAHGGARRSARNGAHGTRPAGGGERRRARAASVIRPVRERSGAPLGTAPRRVS